MSNRKTAIFLLGDPASGKGSVSPLLCERYGLFDFDMGKELQLRREVDAEFEKQLNTTYDKGVLVSSDLVLDIQNNFFESKVFGENGILFNGGPKKISELENVLRWLKLLNFKIETCIYLTIPREESVRRALVRATYDSARQDDNEESVTKRFEYYVTEVSQVLAKLETICGVQKVSGEGSVDEIAKRVVQSLDIILEHNESQS